MSDKKVFDVDNMVLQLNAEGYRREIVNGIEYAVFPTVMLVEGVHHGATGGPVYYSAELLGLNVEEWNGMPVPVQHPRNAAGDYIMCSDPSVAKEWSIGFLDNAHYEDGKLKAEIWVNVTLCRQKHPQLLSLLQSGEQIEVSTGLWAVHDDIAGEWNGEAFESSILQITPDHLALLPGGQGACGWQDGCGVRVNTQIIKKTVEERSMLKYVNGLKKEAIANGGSFVKAELFSYLPAVNEISHDAIRMQLAKHVDTLDKFDGDGNYVEINFIVSVFDDYFVYSTENKDGRTLYKQGYSLENDSVALNEEILAVTEVVTYTPISNDEHKTNEEESIMACCPKKVQVLIASEHSGYVEADREFLSSWNDEQLDKVIALLPSEEELNKSKDEEDDVPADITVNAYLEKAPAGIRSVLLEGQRQLDQKIAGLIKGIMANSRNKFTKEALGAMDLPSLEALAALADVPTYAGVDNGVAELNAHGEEPYESPSFADFAEKK